MTIDSVDPTTQSVRTQPADEHEALRRRVYENYLHASRRWLNWLAIANAGGLVAVGSRLSDQPNGAVAHLLLPAAWLFAAGLILAGGLSWLKGHRMDFSTAHMTISTDHVLTSKPYVARLKFYVTVESIGEALTAVCAAAGLLYPLLGLSLRYAVIGA